ncbi:ABC transporter substrate-binding protein [Roseobacter sp.]|uniref:ABC transporter substrate-binding protein n=1 Tax=Roseobacter sp. TaxID=1907202 RepID=UPI00385C7B21
MRLALFALLLSIKATMVTGFEIEESRTYPDDGGIAMRILSTADADVFEPIIHAFQGDHPGISIAYDVASSAQVMAAIFEEAADYDLVISSAMDLQTKLANDGLARTYTSDATAGLPAWAKWHDQIFAFTQEPAVLVLNAQDFATLGLPKNREDLITLLRDHADVFEGRIGTYDVRVSGLGYLFATQDSRNTESFWRLTEVMGRLKARLYCCSGDMIADVASGRLALAYNVLGSYARARLADTPGVLVVEMDDFVSVMLRTALIPETAQNPVEAGMFIDFLSGMNTRPSLVAQTGLPPVAVGTTQDEAVIRPIRLGPGLLVFLDRMRRETFLRSWTSSIEQD